MIFFLLWLGTFSELSDFQAYLNDKSEHLRFIGDFNRSEISFLDFLISKYVNLYKKPTDNFTQFYTGEPTIPPA